MVIVHVMFMTSLQTQIQDNQLIKGSLTILESKNKSMEVDRDILNTPENEFADIREMQENAILVPLVKAARGEEVKVNRVKDAILNTLDLVIYMIGSDKQASYVLKNAKDMINAPDSKESGIIAPQQNDIQDIY